MKIMRSKYLLAAMALPLMFSCTQDEFDVQGIENNGNAVQNRVNAGKVAFVGGGDQVDTRFDFESSRWENGDKFRLFLMDEWGKGFSCGFGGQCNGEEDNANNTQFKEQQVWNNMYQVVDRFASNFPFTYNLNNGAWENDDAIVEGNYFAVKPATGVAAEGDRSQADILDDVRNRRDVWVYINPVQKFANPEKNTVMTDGLDENQFFLGYTQVYRTDEATENNVLQLPIQMRPILAGIDLRIHNVDEIPFRVEKMVISRRDGKPMPTLAYVRPCNNTPEDYGMRQDDGEKYFAQQWNKVATSANLNDFVAENPDLGLNPDWSWDEAAWQTKGKYLEWGPAFAQPYIVNNRTDECNNTVSDYYWTDDSWTRTAARSVVYYSYPGEKGFTPYECTGELATPAYEYVIDFTDAEGNGVVLNTNEYLRPFITLPHDMNMSEYTFTVYGQQWNEIDKLWREGIIVPGAALVNDASVTDLVEEDGSFTLPTLDPSNEMDYIKAEIRFDDFKVRTSRVVQTTNAGDLLNHLESYFGKMENGFDLANTRNEYFYVETMGDFEVTQPLVDYVQALNDAYGISVGGKALVYFTKTKGVNGTGRIIFPAGLTNDHAIDLFYFSKKAHIVNKGTQVIEKPMIYDYDQTIDEFYKALCASDWYKDGILNDGIDLYHKIEPAIANTIYGGIGSITNEGTLTLKEVIVEAGMIGDAIYNAEGAKLTIKSSGIVGGENLEDEITIHNDGEIVLEKSFIQGTLNNSGKVDVKNGGSEISSELNNSNICNGCPTGPAVVTIWENATLDCPNVVNGQKGEGEIIIKDGGVAYISGTNYGTITVYGELIPAAEKSTLENAEEGVIYVSDGEFKFVTGSYTSGKIMNEGTIYAIGESHVHINGGKGIIDVTLVKEGGWQAASNSIDTYFRYCNEATDNVLKERISDNNISSWQNPIILQYPSFTVDADATKNEQTLSIAYEEKSYTQKEIGLPVRKILVADGATLNLEGTWELLNPFTPGLGNAYQALQVTPKANLIVNNNKVVTIKPYTEDTHVVIDGKMAVKNQAKLLNGGKDQLYEVIVDGAGIFEFAGNAVDNEWTKGNIATWTNTSF